MEVSLLPIQEKLFRMLTYSVVSTWTSMRDLINAMLLDARIYPVSLTPGVSFATNERSIGNMAALKIPCIAHIQTVSDTLTVALLGLKI
jgi:hypothetical protein